MAEFPLFTLGSKSESGSKTSRPLLFEVRILTSAEARGKFSTRDLKKLTEDSHLNPFVVQKLRSVESDVGGKKT
jgi:hypothetical protein